MQAAELMYSPDWDRRVRLSDEALGISRRLDDPEALSTVLNMRFVTLLAPDTYGERSANTVEALAAADDSRTRWRVSSPTTGPATPASKPVTSGGRDPGWPANKRSPSSSSSQRRSG